MTNPDTPPGRLRIAYSKTGKVRFTSHRDVARIWERALRRAEVPVSYSQGFSPRPKLSFGLALATGFESVAEYLDVDVDVAVSEPGSVVTAERLTACLPEGLEATDVVAVDRSARSLQEAVVSCTWFVELDASTFPTGIGGSGADALDGLVARILDAPVIEITRRRKGRDVTDDVRPLVGDLRPATGDADGVALVADLGTKPRSLRPTDLLAGVAEGLVVNRVRRLHQWINVDAAKVEPLDPAVVAPHRELCAT